MSDSGIEIGLDLLAASLGCGGSLRLGLAGERLPARARLRQGGLVGCDRSVGFELETLRLGKIIIDMARRASKIEPMRGSASFDIKR